MQLLMLFDRIAHDDYCRTVPIFLRRTDLRTSIIVEAKNILQTTQMIGLSQQIS